MTILINPVIFFIVLEVTISEAIINDSNIITGKNNGSQENYNLESLSTKKDSHCNISRLINNPEFKIEFKEMVSKFAQRFMTFMKLPIRRVKRQGEGKYKETSEMSQMKLFRVALQLIKNLWADEYMGGTHPLHPNIPKMFMAMYRAYVLEFLFPDVGDDIETKKNKQQGNG